MVSTPNPRHTRLCIEQFFPPSLPHYLFLSPTTMNTEQAQQLLQTVHLLQQQMQAQAQLISTLQQPGTATPSDAPTSRSALLTTLKPQPPSTFTGMTNHTSSVDSWLFELDSYLALTDASDAQKLAFAISCLRDSATIWWRTALQIMTEEERQSITYDTFKQMIRTNYQPVAAAETARAALHRIRQTGSVQAYNALYLRLMNQIVDMSSADQMYLYKQGLQSHIAREVSMQRPTTLMECMNFAQRAEIELRQLRPTPRMTGNPTYPSRAPFGSFRAPAMQSTSAPMEVAAMNGDFNWNDAYGESTASDHTEDTSVHAVNATTTMSKPRFNGNSNNNTRTPLSTEERQRCMQKGLCFVCRQQGHLSRQCPSKNGQRQQQ